MADNKVNSGLLEFSEDQKVFVALDAETSEIKKAVTIDGDGVETDITGEDVTVEALNVTENGTYSETGKAYSPVTVNVAGDDLTVNIATYTLAAQTITGEYNSDFGIYMKQIEIGNWIEPPEYNANFSYRIFCQINGGPLMAEPIIKELTGVQMEVISYDDNGHAVVIFSNPEAFTINIESQTFNFVRAAEGLADMFGENSLLATK